MTSAGLVVHQTVPARLERVFDAFLLPELVAGWLAPGDDWTTIVHHLDARVGGSYSITMREPNGSAHSIAGTYRLIDRPRQLEFTWKAQAPQAPETLVRVRFEARGNQTQVVLTHERFVSEEAKQQHLAGWNACLPRLSNLFAKEVNP